MDQSEGSIWGEGGAKDEKDQSKGSIWMEKTVTGLSVIVAAGKGPHPDRI